MHPSFDGEMYIIWKESIKMIFDSELWNYVLKGHYVLTHWVPTHFVDNELVNKSINLWTTEEKIKMKQGFQTKYLMINVLRTTKYYYVSNCSIAKEVWDTLE